MSLLFSPPECSMRFELGFLFKYRDIDKVFLTPAIPFERDDFKRRGLVISPPTMLSMFSHGVVAKGVTLRAFPPQASLLTLPSPLCFLVSSPAPTFDDMFSQISRLFLSLPRPQKKLLFNALYFQGTFADAGTFAKAGVVL